MEDTSPQPIIPRGNFDTPQIGHPGGHLASWGLWLEPAPRKETRGVLGKSGGPHTQVGRPTGPPGGQVGSARYQGGRVGLWWSCRVEEAGPWEGGGAVGWPIEAWHQSPSMVKLPLILET